MNYNVIISHLPHRPIMQSVKSCCAANFLRHVSKALFFIKIVLKLSYFSKKNAKFSSAGGSAPRIAPHIANFWLRPWMSANKLKFISLNPKFLEFSTDFFRIIDVTTAAYKDRIFITHNYSSCTQIIFHVAL